MTTKKQQQEKPATYASENLKQCNSKLTHEEIQDGEQALHDYLEICREVYWDRVKDGTFPWPGEDSTL